MVEEEPNNQETERPVFPILAQRGNAVDSAFCESEIEAQIAPSKGKKRKRSSYNHHDAETRVRMAKCAREIGLTATARKFYNYRCFKF